MHTIIQQCPGLPGAGLLPIAGRRLVARQIQWLRTVGCGAIAVEIGPSAEDGEIARWLSDEDALGAGVSPVLAGRSPSGRPLSPREIARRAGFPDEAPLLVLPANVLVGGALDGCLAAACARGATVRLYPPPELVDRLEGASIAVVPAAPAEPLLFEPDGWGVALRSLADAMALSTAVIDGRLAPRPQSPAWGIQLHAAEASPGVWIGRGALIERSAELVAPVLVGAGAVVCAEARVGPRVCLGERAVVERGARLCDAVVSPGVIVGQGLDLSNVSVEPGGFRDPITGDLGEIDDPLLLAERDGASPAGLVVRAVAAVLLVLFAPVLLARLLSSRPRAADRVRATVFVDRRRVVLRDVPVGLIERLLDAARGRTPALVGVSPWTGPFPDDLPAALYEDAFSAPLGLFLVDDALAPRDADAATQLRARAWYAHAKSRRVDLRLLCAALRGAHRLSAPPDPPACASLPRGDTGWPG